VQLEVVSILLTVKDFVIPPDLFQRIKSVNGKLVTYAIYTVFAKVKLSFGSRANDISRLQAVSADELGLELATEGKDEMTMVVKSKLRRGTTRAAQASQVYIKLLLVQYIKP
jgi:hypothetical protein